MLNDLEKKLLALALDPSVSPGEMTNASVKLIESFRRRDLSVDDFVAPLSNAQAAERKPRKTWKPAYGLCVFPWGKHKGEMFKDIAPGYLKYQLGWIKEDPARADRFAELATQIENFLTK